MPRKIAKFAPNCFVSDNVGRACSRSMQAPRAACRALSASHHEPFNGVSLSDRLEFINQSARQVPGQFLGQRLIEAAGELQIVPFSICRVGRIDAQYQGGS